MKKFYFLLVMLLCFIISLFFLNSNLYFSILFSFFSLILLIFLVNSNNYTKNFINPQTIFLMGFFLLIFGRFFATILNEKYLSDIFCINFIFYYCLDSKGLFSLFFYLHSILISFGLAFVFSKNKKSNYDEKKILILNKYRLYFVFSLGFFSTLAVIVNNIESILLVVKSGYLALYEGQGEDYEPPFYLIANTISLGCLAILYILKDSNKKSKILFNILFYLFIFKLLMMIGTGSRSHFITGIIIVFWYLFHTLNLKIKHYLLILFSFLLTVISVNILASLSGARSIVVSDESLLERISYIFFNQGISLMVFDISLKYDDYPWLGYLKVVFPGIQIFYKYFDVSERSEFNWSSYVVYKENPIAYYNGNGLGWSLYSDFYVLSFGIFPLFCLLVFLFAKFIIKVISDNSIYYKGLIFILVSTLFTLNRASISSLFFIIIVYSLMYILLIKLKWSKF